MIPLALPPYPFVTPVLPGDNSRMEALYYIGEHGHRRIMLGLETEESGTCVETFVRHQLACVIRAWRHGIIILARDCHTACVSITLVQ